MQRRTKGHRFVYSAEARFSLLLSEIMLKLEISPFYLAASEVTRPLFAEKFNFTPRPRATDSPLPFLNFYRYVTMFSIRRKTSNSRGRRNSNGIHETRAKFAKRDQIRWARGRLSPGRSLIIDDGLMHPSHFIQDVRRASTTRRCPRSMFRSNKITDIQFTFKDGRGEGERERREEDWIRLTHIMHSRGVSFVHRSSVTR